VSQVALDMKSLNYKRTPPGSQKSTKKYFFKKISLNLLIRQINAVFSKLLPKKRLHLKPLQIANTIDFITFFKVTPRVTPEPPSVTVFQASKS